MTRPFSLCLTLIPLLLAATMSAADIEPTDRAIAALKDECPQAIVLDEGARITRIAGQPLAFGASPEISAEQFVQRHAGVFGVAVGDLVVEGLSADGFTSQPVMWEADLGGYKFMLVRYAQQRDGIPVFRADLRLLVRNEADYPLVLAASALRDIGDFAPNLGLLSQSFDPVRYLAGQFDHFSDPQPVIWAGVNNDAVKPELGYLFYAQHGTVEDPDYTRWLFIVAPESGKFLYTEDQIIRTDVSGTVNGMATTPPKADICNPEVSTAMQYAKVTIGSTTAYADVNGSFVIPNSGGSAVTVSSPMAGRYFTVTNSAGSTETLTLTVTPPGPASFLHNSANSDELVRSQVNGYIQANLVRDFCLTYNPTYPTIYTQLNFPIYVNRTDGYCPGNAWYDGSSINFCRAGSIYPNTAFDGVVHHEYGHHMVAMAGSGQDEYGEGMGDCVAMLITNDPVMGYGFEGNCSAGIRTASNTCQYSASSCSSCGSEIHACGQLLSGCIWSVRTQLQATNPTTYLQIVSNLTVNSILLHNGGTITPQIAIDFLTLDDNDGNLNNGTPHHAEICAGFAAHNMACPALPTLTVTPSTGLSSSGNAGGPFTPSSQVYTLTNSTTSSINYTVSKTQTWLTLSSTGGSIPGSGSVDVTVSINTNANSLPNGTYTDTVTFTNTTNHNGDTTRTVTLNVGLPSVVYSWNMNTNPGWTTLGSWAWGDPTAGSGDHGGPDPQNGHTGTNVYGYNLTGGYTNNMSETHLTTTAINCTGLTQVHLKFWRWLGVEQSLYDHAYVRVSNNGSSWTEVWANPNTTIDDQAWLQQDYDISASASNSATVYIRWTMGATDTAWTYCGWNIDDVEIWAVGACTAPAITTQPQSQTKCVGQAVTFTVVASGTAPLSYQWRKGGVNIGGATASSYTLAAVASGDAANYDCVVTNACGNATSNAATLTVNTAPAITTHPQSQTKCVGQAVTFTVAASGTAPLSYQWRKGGVNISGATASSYTIAAVVSGDAANYDCVVTNTCGSATSNAATLTVNTAPAITTHPQSQTKCVGDSVTFTVVASGSAPLSYHWRKGGVNITGATASSYTILALGLNDEGSYDCVVTNTCGSATSNAATLTVSTWPAVTTHPQSQARCVGQSVTFTVAANGTAPLSYQWRKGGVNIGSATASSYTIAAVATGDAADYDCVVTNTCGSETSNPATLTVNTAPAITTHPQSQTRCVGEAVTFTVAANGTAPLSYQWRKGGVNLGGATASSYTIAAVATGDAADYDCVVTNMCGSETSNAATLTVNSGPAILTPPASQVRHVGQAVTFSVVVDGTPPLTYQWRHDGVDLGGATADTLTLSALVLTDAGQYDCVVSSVCGSVSSAAATLAVWPIGDANCDGWVNFDDILPFVAAITSEAGYESAYPDCYWLNSDCNLDSDCNFDDINPFVGLLSE